MRIFAWLLAVFVAPQLAVPAAAQNVLDQARRHYDAAAYEEALSTLATADRGTRSQIVEVEQYRALCLIALGRMADAERAVTAVIEADPLYVPPASPRVQSFISEVRRNALPAVARRLLESGRAAYTKKDLDLAREHFDLLLRVLADPAMQGRSEAADLRVLADGFVTLVTASSAPAGKVVSEEAPDAPPAPLPAPAAPVLVPAVVVREVLPPWVPDQISANQEYSGAIKVTIGADGRVKAANIQDPSHPAYDARLVQAASTWRYKPATRNGQPVDSERTIAVRLRPAQ